MTTTFTQLEKQKTEMLATVEGWSATRLAFRPTPGAWSATEMLDHMVKVENGILAGVRQRLKTPHRIGIRDRAGVLLLNRVFRSDRRVKVPASAKEVMPGDTPDLNSVLQRWSDGRIELADFLAHTPSEQFRGGVFRHPVAGWMSLQQVLDFFSVHIIHHSFQLARLRDASKGL